MPSGVKMPCRGRVLLVWPPGVKAGCKPYHDSLGHIYAAVSSSHRLIRVPIVTVMPVMPVVSCMPIVTTVRVMPIITVPVITIVTVVSCMLFRL